ncbi:MAG TPA: NYN domain-containing protein, partial [Roseiarcus sp.]
AKSNAEETKFINRTLDGYASLPGLFFTFAERVKKQTALRCEQCGNQHSHTGESGVDVILTVEMIKHAAMHQHEYLTLVSSDRDFIPLLSYLKDQGERVLHVATQDPNREMRSLTWKQIGLRERYAHLCQIDSGDKYIIFTTPTLNDLTREAQTILSEQGSQCEVIDLADATAIPDKDLRFVLENQNIFFRRKEAANSTSSFAYNNLYESIGRFRAALRIGDVIGDRLPYVMHSGSLYACGGDQNSRWIVLSNADMMEPWRNRPLPPARP